MDSFACHLYRHNTTPVTTVMMTASLMKKLGCTNGMSVRLACGNKEVITRITLARKHTKDAIFVPQRIANLLALPTSSTCRICFHHKTLRIGPVIGILTTGFTGSQVKPFGGRTGLFQQFLLAGIEANPIFYVFTPAMVNWRDETVSGWLIRYQPSLQQYVWKMERMPLPDVVYERVPNRKMELVPSVVNCKARLLNQKHRIHWFNQGFFNKWDIHEQLYNHPFVSGYFPETVRSPNVTVLKDMLRRHRMIYLKPSGGSLGLGIIRITYDPKTGYYCRYHDLQSQRNVLKRFTSLDKLVKYVFAHQTARIDKYIAQQGIRLIRQNDRPVDFRLHLHKDRRNEWQVTGIAAKVAGLGSVTTHVRTGGSVIPADDLFRAIYGSNRPELRLKLERAAKEIAMALEETTDGLLGELGMDMGIDIEQRVWMFEVNSKPGRHIFHHPRLRVAGRQSAYYITEYSMKLAGFI